MIALVGALQSSLLGAPQGEQSIHAVAFSRDGVRVAVGCGSQNTPGRLLVWNVETKQVEKSMAIEKGVSSLAFSSDDKRLALTPMTCPPQVLKWPSLELEYELDEACRGPVAFSPDGAWLATSAEDFTIHLHELATRKERSFPTGHQRAPTQLVFSSDGKRIASAAWEERAVVWNVADGKEAIRLKSEKGVITYIDLTSDGRWILTGESDALLRVRDARTGTPHLQFTGVGGVNAAAYSESTQKLVAVGFGQIIGLYNRPFDEPTQSEAARIADAVTRLDADSYSDRESARADLLKIGVVAVAELARVAKNSPSAEVRVSARRTRQELLSRPQAELQGTGSRIWNVSLSADGSRLAAGDDGGHVRVWDLSTAQELATLDLQKLPVTE